MNLRQAVEHLFEHRPVLIGLDFDGTLAPLVEHPSLATPDHSAIEILGRLATRPGISVAVISGRAMADLSEHVGELPGVILIGEHGNDVGVPVAPSPLLEEAKQLVGALVAATAGSVSEVKPRSVTFHYRNVEPGGEAHALTLLRSWAAQRPQVSVLEGKEVIELSVASRNKGDAITDLAGEEARILYIGDDTTDETVFAVLGPDDVGIKVGPGETSAAHRVDDVAGVVEVLEVIDLIST